MLLSGNACRIELEVPLQPTRFAQPASAGISIRWATTRCGRALSAVVARQRYVGTPRDDWLGLDDVCFLCAGPKRFILSSMSVLGRRRYLGRERGIWASELVGQEEWRALGSILPAGTMLLVIKG